MTTAGRRLHTEAQGGQYAGSAEMQPAKEDPGIQTVTGGFVCSHFLFFRKTDRCIAPGHSGQRALICNVCKIQRACCWQGCAVRHLQWSSDSVNVTLTGSCVLGFWGFLNRIKSTYSAPLWVLLLPVLCAGFHLASQQHRQGTGRMLDATGYWGLLHAPRSQWT